jgi:hypothetical protein
METGRDLVIERQQDMEVLCACFILSVLVKDRIIVGPHVILNTASHLAGQITHSNREAELFNSGQESFCKSAHPGGSKDVQGADKLTVGKHDLSDLAW